MFTCATCGTAVTLDLEETDYPTGLQPDRELSLTDEKPQLIPQGRFAVNPRSVRWKPYIAIAGFGREFVSNGPGRSIVVNVADIIALTCPPDPPGGGCCGWGPDDGPNLACEACGREIATEVNDCGMSRWWVTIFLDDVLGAPPAPRVGNPPAVQRRHDKRRRPR